MVKLFSIFLYISIGAGLFLIDRPAVKHTTVLPARYGAVKGQPADTLRTADEYVPPYDGPFLYGNNLGYYGNGWADSLLAKALRQVEANTLRAKLTDSFVTQWGMNIRLSTFQAYVKRYDMQGIVLITGEPAAFQHGDTTRYAGPKKPHSQLFRNMYSPIWTASGTINPENAAAVYYYNLCKTYGPYISFWEVVNEPDFTGNPSQWLNRPPLPEEMSNLYAPIFHYIRLLRIAYEVIKRYDPDAYVAAGGLGYYQFYDCLLRYTDNPDSGKVTPQYPRTGGAYMDVVSYHVYPYYYLKKYKGRVNGVDQWQFFYASDNAIAWFKTFQENFDKTSRKYGYDGIKKPRKHYIISETNVPKRSTVFVYGSDAFQRNFVIKAFVKQQKLGIISVNFFTTGDHDTLRPADYIYPKNGDEYKQMGLYNNLRQHGPGSERLNEAGVAWKTYGRLIGRAGYVYDSVKTKELGLSAWAEPAVESTVDGAAFRHPKSGKYRYILWARATGDKSEDASAVFSVPGRKKAFKVYPWDFTGGGKVKMVPGEKIILSAAPIFVEEG